MTVFSTLLVVVGSTAMLQGSVASMGDTSAGWRDLFMIVYGVLNIVGGLLFKQSAEDRKSLRDQITALENKNGALEKDFAALEAHVGIAGGVGLSARLTQVHTDVSTLRTEIRRDVSQIMAQLSAVTAELTGLRALSHTDRKD